MRNKPENEDGHLYYIRLKTEKGLFYKIGFTRKASVEARFSYGGSENYKLIDKVLMFKYSVYAFGLEQLLHHHLRHRNTYDKYRFSNLFRDLSKHPLFGDGQTELYREDVLGLDPEYQPPFSLFGRSRSAKKYDLVRQRLLDMSGFDESIKETESNKIYRTLDQVLQPPLIDPKDEYVERNGDWVVALHIWSSKNCMDGGMFSNETTVHSATPLPTTKQELMALEEFSPAWLWTKSIPKEIGRLKKLKIVRFSGVQAAEVPEELYSLEKLEELDLSNSEITSISNQICKLRSLEVLDFSYCENLQELPIEIEQLPCLREIRVTDEEKDRFKSYLPNKPHLLVSSGPGVA